LKSFNLLIIISVFSIGNLFSQVDNHALHHNGWYMYFGNHSLNEKWGLHTEFQWRRHDWISQPQQNLFRTGLDFKINDRNMITAGYGFIITYPYGEQPSAYHFNEHRIWYQYLHTHSFHRMQWQHRFRFEKRFIESKKEQNGEFVSDEFKYRNRLRYFFRINIPLTSKSMSDKTWFLSFYEEAFIQFGKQVDRNYFDQNRLYGAIGYRWNKDFNIQAGYLYQFIVKSGAERFEHNHTLQLGITKNFDFSRKVEK